MFERPLINDSNPSHKSKGSNMLAVDVSQVQWGSYLSYRGPYILGKVRPPPIDATAPFERKLLAAITVTEGGHMDAVQSYDVCILTAGAIQRCESSMCGTSDLLHTLRKADETLLDPLHEWLRSIDGELGARVEFQPYGVTSRFTLIAPNGSVTRIDRPEAQRRLFLLNSTGKEGTWDDHSKLYAKSWNAVINRVLAQPAAVQAQLQHYTENFLLGFLTRDVREQLAQVPPTYRPLLTALTLSFAANLPAVAAKHFMIALEYTRTWSWSDARIAAFARQLTWGPGIAIYPQRYNKLRPELERLFGLDLPDIAIDLQNHSEQINVPGVPSFDFTHTADLQKALIQLGYDLGPKGADGVYGLKTTAAVKSFQKAHSLEVDGRVGPKTVAALQTALTAAS